MGWLHKKSDPISDRARDLNAKIAALESRIKDLNDQSARKEAAEARFRSTAYPNQSAVPAPPPKPAVPAPDPVFEKVDQHSLKHEGEAADDPRRFNDLGLRKYDLVSLWKRLREQLREPPAPNPRLVNYLAAGSIQGLRPLRYEKRVARRRFIALSVILGLVLLGIFLSLAHRH